MEAEAGVRRPQVRRHLEPRKLEEARERLSPRTSRRNAAPPEPGFQTSLASRSKRADVLFETTRFVVTCYGSLRKLTEGLVAPAQPGRSPVPIAYMGIVPHKDGGVGHELDALD